MYRKSLLKLAVIIFSLLLVSTMAYATPITFFGEDLNGGRTNADTAHDDFSAHLVGVGTEDFENFSLNTRGPLTLDFGSAGTATLSGSGYVSNSTSSGRWATSGSNYWNTNEDFTIQFSQAISAFGFYGTDMGDFGGQVLITYQNGTSTTLNIGNTVGAPNGSVLYFGFYEDDPTHAFTSITFANTNSSDFFGFDDMTIGTYHQITNPVPEPCTILLMGSGLLGLVGFGRKKLTKKS